jgi:uncharacterized protein (DUF1800 family)
MTREIRASLRLGFARRTAASAVASLVLSGAIVAEGTIPAVADIRSTPPGPVLDADQKIIHLLNRIGFGPRPQDIERVKKIGIDRYIDLQLHPESIDDPTIKAKLANYPSLKNNQFENERNDPASKHLPGQLGPEQKKDARVLPEGGADDTSMRAWGEEEPKYDISALHKLQAQKIIRAVYSERQLQEVMTDFWFNHFNIFWVSTRIKICRKPTGPPGTLQSTTFPNHFCRRVQHRYFGQTEVREPDRSLTTEFEMSVIRPHTLGKFKDILLATAKSPAMLLYLDNYQSVSPDAKIPNARQAQAANGAKSRKPGINENYARELMELHSLGVEGGYTQKDVQEVARCLTGWTIDRPEHRTEFVFRSFLHDNGEKTVLGHKIPAGGGVKDGEMVIDILAHHPSTAKFISSKLVGRFVSDTPPQGLVDRVASVYAKTEGDIREMLLTILTSSEFNSTTAYRAKIKSPFELAVSAIRALGAELSAPVQTALFIAKMGQPLYLNRMPTGYPDTAERWVSAGSLFERLNFGLALTTNRVRGARFDVKRAAGGVGKKDKRRLMGKAISALLNGDVSTQTRRVLEKQMKQGAPVKGTLGVVPAIPQSEELIAERMEQMQQSVGGAGKGGKGIGNAAQMQGRLASDSNLVSQKAMSAEDMETAKVFGLVLGSPEFQRR